MKSSQIQKILVSHKLFFSKYQASGNDFIIIDDRENHHLELSFQLIRKLCHRKFGIGADGLILLRLSEKADFQMAIFNSDGLEATMCGNGLRSLVAYLKNNDLICDSVSIETKSGIHQCRIDNDLITISFSDPTNISLNRNFDGRVFHLIHTGVDHAVCFTKEIEDPEFVKISQKVRYDSSFSRSGVNVSFASINHNQIKIRTYEKGCEEETLACGTGAMAASVLAALIFELTPPFEVEFASKDRVFCDFQKNGKNIQKTTLTGVSKGVFDGKFNLFSL